MCSPGLPDDLATGRDALVPGSTALRAGMWESVGTGRFALRDDHPMIVKGTRYTTRCRRRLPVLVSTTPATITAPPSSANTVGVSPSTIHDTSTPNTGTR